MVVEVIAEMGYGDVGENIKECSGIGFTLP